MTTTTVQVDAETHARLKAVKGDMTFDELLRLYLDLVDPEEIARARRQRQIAYQKWQEDAARQVRAGRRNKRVF